MVAELISFASSTIWESSKAHERDGPLVCLALTEAVAVHYALLNNTSLSLPYIWHVCLSVLSLT